MAEYYSADLSEKVTRGHTENALKCQSNGSIVPYGYVVDKEKHYQIDPEKATVVLEIFNRYTSGETVTEIITDLNARGLRTSKGNEFNKNSLHHMLKNRKYLGEYRYNNIVTPGGIPAIVPEDIFNRAVAILESNKRAPARKKAKEEYLLTTKLFCGDCLAMMVGDSAQKSNGNIYRYYKCVGAKKHICRKKAVRKEWIEEIAFKLTMKILMSDDDLQKIADRIMELQKAENTIIPILERQLEDIRTSIDNILKAIEMGVCTRSTKTRLEELEAEEERIKCDIEREQMGSQLITEDQIWYIFDKFRKMDLTMPKQRQRLFDSFLQSIVLFDDRLIISFNYRSQPVTIMLDQLVEFVNGDISDLKSSASPIRKASHLWGAFLFLESHRIRTPRVCHANSLQCAAHRTTFQHKLHPHTGVQILVRVTKKARREASCFFIQAAGLVYHHALACISSPQAYIITRSVYICGLMIYKASP